MYLCVRACVCVRVCVCVCVCVCVQGGIYLLISVAEIRYRHDLVRLCHKFYFCPFQMKIPRIDEEKELYALHIQGSVWDFFVWGEESIQKNFWSHATARKFFRACRGSRGMLPQKSLKR